MLYDWLIAPFVEFAFMQRALVGSLALSLSAAPVGVFFLLRRMSLVGDAMAHAILPGAAVGFLVAGLSLPAMTLGGFAAGLAVALAAGAVARGTHLREEASLAAFYLIALAAGVLLISIKGSNVDLLHVLFGTVLALNDDALLLLGGIASVTLLLLAIIYRPLVIDCVDPGFLGSVGAKGWVPHFLFLALAVLNLVGGFQALGTLMAVGLMILPPIAARFWSETIGGLSALAFLLGACAAFFGLLASYHFALPSGPAIVLSAGVLYLASLVFGRKGGLVTHFFPGKHLEA